MIFAGKTKADIYHITGDTHYVVLALPAKRTILTIHDCVFLRNTTGLKRLVSLWLFLKLPVRNCRYVTTISQKSKDEIIKHTGCYPDKVIVIPNPIDKHIFFEKKEFNEKEPVLLFIGSTPNKNLRRIIEALAGIACMLEIIGDIPEDEAVLLGERKMRFRQMVQLSETEIAQRYATCDIVVFPSLYEGFGLPILEGQKSGRPVLTSNISPMREVAGDGACLVDPKDVGSIRKGIERIIKDAGYREYLVTKGFENTARYTSEKIAGEYLSLYNSILN